MVHFVHSAYSSLRHCNGVGTWRWRNKTSLFWIESQINQTHINADYIRRTAVSMLAVSYSTVAIPACDLAISISPSNVSKVLFLLSNY